MEKRIENIYGKKIRVRVMGILVKNDQVLLISHRGLNDANEFWMPPGGGVEFGEDLKGALQREFQEEVNLSVEVGRLLYIHEHIQAPLHAVEFFFEIPSFKGSVELGTDPETQDFQLIDMAKFMSISDLNSIKSDLLHVVFQNLTTIDDLLKNEGNILF